MSEPKKHPPYRKISLAGTFLMTSQQHRETAARIRKNGDPDAEERAQRFENLAKVAERRQARTLN